MSLWRYTCVDTMKSSRDTCFPTSHQLSSTAIQQGVNLCAGMSVTHITVATFFDYPAYFALWVNAVRAVNKKVWFRPRWAHYEGNNGQPADMTPSAYVTATQNFITANPFLFQAGDILDACAEPESGPYWNATYGANALTANVPNAGTDEYNRFILNLDSQLQSTLLGLGITGVLTNIRSTNSYFATHVDSLYLATTRTLGVCCFDSYPEGASTDPTTCANARATEIQSVIATRPGSPVILGEVGFSVNSLVTDQQQYDVLFAECAAIAPIDGVIGMNYWVAQGNAAFDGSRLFAGSDSAGYTYRPAAGIISSFYQQQLRGWLDASTPSVSVGGVTRTALPGTLSVMQAVGQRSTAKFTVRDDTGVLNFFQGQPVSITSGGGNGSPNIKHFTGYVMSAARSSPGWASTMLHDLNCVDQHYLADKRIAASSYANQTVGFMVTDLWTNFLATEGVIIQRGVNVLGAQQSSTEQNVMSVYKNTGGVTLTQDTTTSMFGAASLKVVTDGLATFQSVSASAPASQFVSNTQYTLSCYMKCLSGTPTVRFYCQANEFISGGFSIGSVGNVTLSTTWTRYSFTVTMPNPILATTFIIGLRMDTGAVAQAITVWMDGWQIEKGASASAWELGSLQQSVQPGPTVASYLVNYVPVSKALDDLANLAGMTWQIDENKVLWFTAPSALPAPWAFDGTQADDSPGAPQATLQETNPLYRNAQWILSIKDVTAAQTETRQGDGKLTAFTFNYPLHSTPTVTVNAVSKTVGIGQVDTGKDWYWNQGSNVLSQDTAGVKLISTDTLSVTYIGEWTSNVYSQSAGAVTAEQTLEGGGTGLVEEAHSDAAITTAGQGFQLAGALLARYAQIGRILTFRTRVAGLSSQQLLTVNLPPAWNMAGVQALIESVTVTEDGFWWVYDVKALIGPVNDSWVQYFQRIANPLGTLPGTAGTSQTVALLQSETAAWNWAATYTATVTACPTFPMTFPFNLC